MNHDYMKYFTDTIEAKSQKIKNDKEKTYKQLRSFSNYKTTKTMKMRQEYIQNTPKLNEERLTKLF